MTTATAAASPKLSAAPFLVWPVSRREFYRTICVALAPPLAWGLIIFGSRILAMLLLSIIASSLMYLLLKRISRWRRARLLQYMHCLLCALVLVALVHPSWPVWIVVATAFLFPLLLTFIGGPGKERVHLAVVAALVLQYLLLPWVGQWTYVGKSDAILARDRLFMGDIRNQAADVHVVAHWPGWAEIGGNDAVPREMPAVVAARTFDQLAAQLPDRPGASAPPVNLHIDGGNPLRASLQRTFDEALALQLPGMDEFYFGIAPNRVGMASLIGLSMAGLFLCYRHILRAQSVLFFLIIFFLATLCCVFLPATLRRVGFSTIWELISQFPGQILTLFNFLLLSSDAPFAGVIILGLPGTQPLTARARRIFLAMAAIGAAILHRWYPEIPAATLTLCALMPLSPIFDRLFAQQSWLNLPKTTRIPAS